MIANSRKEIKEAKDLNWIRFWAHLVHHFILAEANQLPKEAHYSLARWPSRTVFPPSWLRVVDPQDFHELVQLCFEAS